LRPSADAEPLDAASFVALVEPHLPRMIRLAARLGPRGGQDDVVQEALLRAWRHRGRFDPGRGPFSAWLAVIVANEGRRAASRQRPVREIPKALGSPAPDDHIDIEAALRRLPPRQRLAVDCYYFAGLSAAETAAVMGCSEGTVKSTLSDARQRLRRELKTEA